MERTPLAAPALYINLSVSGGVVAVPVDEAKLLYEDLGAALDAVRLSKNDTKPSTESNTPTS